jgi:aspartate/methionine/tyrosine aminotransferase
MRGTSRFVQKMTRGERAFQVMEEARRLQVKGQNIIELEVGEPDFDVPQEVIEELQRQLGNHQTHYERTQGNPQLMDAIAQDLTRRTGTEIKAEYVVIFPGAKPAIAMTLLAVLNNGDVFLITDPTYPVYPAFARACTDTIGRIPLFEKNGFRIDPDHLRRMEAQYGSAIKALLYANPQNPTGGVATRQDVEELVRFAERCDCYLMADEIYGRILAPGVTHTSLLSIPGAIDRAIVFGGMSKIYAMTGVRLGYVIIKDPDLRTEVVKLAGNTHGCVDPAKQLAGIVALNGPQTASDYMVDQFNIRRERIVDGFSRIPLVNCTFPPGAFYALPNMSDLMVVKGITTSMELERRLLHEAGVAGLAGTSFGEQGEGYMRFSFANTVENIDEAIRRIDTWARQGY